MTDERIISNKIEGNSVDCWLIIGRSCIGIEKGRERERKNKHGLCTHLDIDSNAYFDDGHFDHKLELCKNKVYQ